MIMVVQLHLAIIHYFLFGSEDLLVFLLGASTTDHILEHIDDLIDKLVLFVRQDIVDDGL